MDRSRAQLLREVLDGTPWVSRTTAFARALRSQVRTPGGLILIGTPQDEPWHLTAHLEDEARFAEVPELAPTLVRWSPPPGAPEHLAIGLDRLEAARRGESLLVVADDAAPAALLERVEDVRRNGATVFALDDDDADLESLAHEVLPVREEPSMTFETAQHLLSVVAGEPLPRYDRGFRARLARLLDAISGPSDVGEGSRRL